MDILKPELIWVEGRCYRFCDNTVWSSEQSNVPYQEDYYQSEYEDIMGDEACDGDEMQIDLTNNGSFKHLYYVPKAFYGFIIGYKGSVKKKIETETNTSITVPKINSNHEEIEIVGRSRASVISCRRRIDLLIESSRNKIRFTHFISIPLNTEIIMHNFENFKSGILNYSQHELEGISDDIFVSSKKLHLTIGMLRLLNEKERHEAAEALSSCVKNIIQPILMKIQNPITIKIQGLNYMNDDPSNISVLYGEVLENKTLQEIADKTFEYFIQKGLMTVMHSEKVKLHMTLMKSSRNINKDQRRTTFNASKILKDYKNYVFGETTLKTINISERETRAADGYYNMLTNINLS
ncbi:hypothetical protein PV325_003207 [Microctonus aethiopoides]|uniref:K Homology domain-containing protein n=1 Tax=Microctonus aethiopoides TaxID=144406 RepID=A0AA39FLN2_9HYME|nr:hypothetical protein PV325_003207 [Microctonus aethiopoides]KAK0093837.1 hypothetical protein PV326_012503 [Microctonus aethiopoides]KAK0171899.1 hypothetical protein PV328_005291 [Microctonus aethiopoides]